MGKSLVIVESPTKAKTIGKFLGKDYTVLASYGHIRDLPTTATEIPAAIKKEKWTRLGINVEDHFAPLYIVPSEKKKRVQDLKNALKDADELLLATDEDREGESISWHLCEVLKPKVPTKRLVFHEITKEAIARALTETREVNDNLVRAQETRRIVDRLYGYSVSPLLWKKVAPRLSAGRVQSVAMKLLVERERERMSFISAQYWDLIATFMTKSQESFESTIVSFKNKRIALGKDFDPKTGKLNLTADVVLLDETSAQQLRSDLLTGNATVTSVEEKPYTNRPSPPFTTSTLQQEGVRKLGFPARKTMQTAQVLYENGLITYMRTDSTTLSEEAVTAARSLIKNEYGDTFLPDAPRLYKTAVKNAQEAHEAIRPAGTEFTPIPAVYEKLGADAGRLYELIWKRTVACQMKDSYGKRVGVEIAAKEAIFRASGKTIEFAGFLRAYVEGADDPDAELENQEKILPQLKVGDTIVFEKLDALGHDTQPPARFTEGSLIKELERLGIGRPSTWATIVDVVLSRDYAFKKGQALVPTFLAIALTNLMEGHFTNLLDYAFTARLEDDLDAISRGEYDSEKYLTKFYIGNGHPGLKTMVKTGEDTIDPRIACGLPMFGGEGIEVRIGRYGAFVTDGTIRAGLPDGLCPDELDDRKISELLAIAAKGPESIGSDPVTGKKVYVKTGRFGPYVQLGEQTEEGEKPKMASLLRGMTTEGLDLPTALKLLELPKVLGKSESGDDIVVANGRFGPYIKAGTDTRSLPPDKYTPITITHEDALALLKEPKAMRGRGPSAATLKELGVFPGTEKKVVVKSGRYGPYVTDGEINATIPKETEPTSLTIEQGVALIQARIDSGAVPKKRRGAKKPAKAKKEAAPKKTKAKAKGKGKKKAAAAEEAPAEEES